MAKTPWKPWHEVVTLRDDVKSGELSLNVFAADLYDVAMATGKRPVYERPEEFFALTYPTYNLRELAKDVVHRLAGKNDKAVRQLELTYGGGKTHTLITLYHLVSDPEHLPDLPAVEEFRQHIGIPLPKACVAVVPFDKLDVEKGMEVLGPEGARRWLKHPWSVIAFQIAGSEGLKLLHADGKDAERNSPPAENLLTDLLSLPAKDGKATLILIDELLMFGREKVALDPAWRGILVDFFDYLVRAAVRVDQCCIVASLLATDPRKSDQLGKELTQELYSIFRREREEGVQPVVKEDVAEVLRRRFFTPDSIRDRESFRSHVVAALKGIADIDEQTRKEGNAAEERFLSSFPFHPDLTEVFYTKWTNLEGFQRTRGILRTYALALRDAQRWDASPLVGTNVFLMAPGKDGISEAARELTTVAATEDYEGKRQEWTGILEGELNKAADIQDDYPGIRCREVEQAVFATFLHSQPVGHKALTRELLVLLGHTRPDKIELEKALEQWAQTSWFLDEAALEDVEKGGDGTTRLPKSWRLGSRPNLNQMHADSCQNRVSDELVESVLNQEIRKVKTLTSGASAAGARTHNLPERPNDIEDDGEFHYAVLSPKAASESGKPSAEAKRFIDETTGPDKPRVFRNAVVLACPSRDGLDAARNAIRDHLGWMDVQDQLKTQELDPIREARLGQNITESKGKITGAIQQAYSIVVTVSSQNEIQAFKIVVGSDPLFTQIKNDTRSRIQDTAVSSDALLPEGPYDLWREGETSRRVKDLVGAFAQVPSLPKMLRSKAILDTLVEGCRGGSFVFRLSRPDKSVRTWWKEDPDETALQEPALELVLPESAKLAGLPARLLSPGVLPELWPEQDGVTVKKVAGYFSGGKVVQVQRQGYEEPMTIPQADRAVVESAISSAVESGELWLLSGPASILGGSIPAGVLTDAAQLLRPPAPIPVTDILAENLPQAWQGDQTSAVGISNALSTKVGKTLPWVTVRKVIGDAINARMVECTQDSGPWPCELAGAQLVKLRKPKPGGGAPPPPPPPPPQPGVRAGEADLKVSEIQDLADVIGDLKSAAAGHEIKFHLRIELGSGDTPPPTELIERVNQILGEVSEDLELE